MKRSSRLSRSEDISRVRREGRSFAHTAIVLGVSPNQLEKNRIAIIAGRSVGGAVQRNLAKRRIRSAFQSFHDQLHQGCDLVIIARKPILTFEYQSLITAMKALLEQAGLMKEIVD